MAIISFSKNATVDFIPAYGGNRQSQDPCVFKLKYVPYSRVIEYQKVIASKIKGLTEPRARMDAIHEVQKQEFAESVLEVKNYLIDDVPAASLEEVYDTAPEKLITEVLQAIEDAAKLNEGQRKNS